jgi:hypothetical protein
MRLLAAVVFALLSVAAPSWASSDIRELTKDNVESQSFEFKFKRADYWFFSVVKVTVRPRNRDLEKIRDRVGGRLYRCQETANQFGLQMDGSSATETDGSLVYTFRIPRGTHKCFYFWHGCSDVMPCLDIWWVSLDSPLVRGEETPK